MEGISLFDYAIISGVVLDSVDQLILGHYGFASTFRALTPPAQPLKKYDELA